jgi:hypothetical protein
MKYLIAIATLALAGCTATMPKLPERVEIPVAIPCPVEVPAVPLYQFGNLKPTDTIWTKVQVLLSDRQLAIAYEQELNVALASCK